MELRIPVIGPPAGAVLSVSPEKIRFSPVPAGVAGTASLSVRNVGGTAGSWQCEVAPPFQTAETGIKLAPGEKQTVSVALNSADAGPFRGWLKISGEQQIIDVPVDGVVTGTSSPIKAVSMPAGTAPSLRPASLGTLTAGDNGEAEKSATVPIADPGAFQHIAGDSHAVPTWTTIKVTDVGPTSAVFTWPASVTDAAQYKFEERLLSLDQNHQLKIDWLERPNARVRLEGQTVVAELQGLQPQTVHSIRISPLSAVGSAGNSLFKVEFTTPPKPGLFRATSITCLVAAGLLGTAFVTWRRVRRNRSAL